jgi:hypothetical protein
MARAGRRLHQQAAPKAISVGSSGRMMIIDGSDHAYATDTIVNSWTAIMTTISVNKIAVGGPTGRMLVLDTSGNVWFREGTLAAQARYVHAARLPSRLAPAVA